MHSAPQVSDPSDWPEGFPKLSELDAHLRCPICKEFLRGAVILNCHHTFCSACLRRHLDKESTCPACRESASTVQIRRNVAIEEVANCFVDCREQLLKTVQDSVRRALEDQKRLETRSGRNNISNQDEDDVHVDLMAMEDLSRTSPSSSRRSASIYPNKRQRVSTRRRAAASQQSFTDEEIAAWEDGALSQESSTKSSSHQSRRGAAARGEEDDDDDFVLESEDRVKSPPRKRITRQSLALEQQDRPQQSGSQTRTRSGSRVAASQPQSPTDFPTSSSAVMSSQSGAPPQQPQRTTSPEEFGLCPCPVCGCAILQQSANQHLDLCMEGKRDFRFNLQYDQVKVMDRESMLLYSKHGTASPPSTTVMNMMGSSSPSTGRRGGKDTINSTGGGGGGNPFYKEGNGHSGSSVSWSVNSGSISSLSSTNGTTSKLPERKPFLPKLAYGVLTEKQLRKKLQELGLASNGDKALMQKRHAEYLTRYNANCDSLRPYTDAELRRQMVEWERAYESNEQSKVQQRRAQEQLQRQVQEEQQLRLSQESESQGSPSQETSAVASNPLPSSTTGTFIPNHANNTNAAVAVAEAASFAHAARYAQDYADLIADIKRRNELAKAARIEQQQQQQREAEGSTQRETSSGAAAGPAPPIV